METKEIVLPENWEVKEVKGNKIILKEAEMKGLPKTYNECVNRFGEYITITTNPPKESTDAIRALCKLLTCRNAWWNQLGWKPELSDVPNVSYFIGNYRGIVGVNCEKTWNRVLAFPTPEVRDQFLYSFRDLIEEAKELL